MAKTLFELLSAAGNGLLPADPEMAIENQRMGDAEQSVLQRLLAAHLDSYGKDMPKSLGAREVMDSSPVWDWSNKVKAGGGSPTQRAQAHADAANALWQLKGSKLTTTPQAAARHLAEHDALPPIDLHNTSSMATWRR